jgi:hypothetical protein
LALALVVSPRVAAPPRAAKLDAWHEGHTSFTLGWILQFGILVFLSDLAAQNRAKPRNRARCSEAQASNSWGCGIFGAPFFGLSFSCSVPRQAVKPGAVLNRYSSSSALALNFSCAVLQSCGRTSLRTLPK